MVLRAEHMDALFAALKKEGYTIIGPTVRNNAVVVAEITGSRDLPQNVRDIQTAGAYRLGRRKRAGWFSFAAAADSYKRFLVPPEQCLWRLQRTDRGFAAADRPRKIPRYALFGVRPCDLKAIAVLDRIFAGATCADPEYVARRRRAFIVAANCTQPAATCFCTTMGSGPKAQAGFDLALTELTEPSHVLLLEAGSAKGEALLRMLPVAAPSRALSARAEEALAAAGNMAQRFDKGRVRRDLIANPEHPRWREVANRCLACGNCTLVCPTCFCSRAFERIEPHGRKSERWRAWDSCFSDHHSYIHGGSVRATIRSRYRQWLTHKLGYWHAQFGVDGCVGCGRCITWCPAAIDLTQEARTITREEA